MTQKALRIATRTSQLALWQANEVKRRLQKQNPTLKAELVLIDSDGDLAQTQGFDRFGYKGIFTKRIEAALLDGRADIAVHSMKDVHSVLPESLLIAAMLEREDPRDAFISKQYPSLRAMPEAATLGTASIRRSAVIRHLRPDIIVAPFRGNVPTRIEKLEKGEVDATFLAVAGLKRLGLSEHITQIMPADLTLPAVAQGAVGIECRKDDADVLAMLETINHRETFLTVSAERAMLAAIDGDCHTPLCGLAQIAGDALSLEGIWYHPSRPQRLSVYESGLIADAAAIGRRAGETLKAQMQDTV